jgi:hypothetical protein
MRRPVRAQLATVQHAAHAFDRRCARAFDCRHGMLTTNEIPKNTAGEKSARGKQNHKSEKPTNASSGEQLVFSGAL